MYPSKDRCKGTLSGALIGDCLGAPFESNFWKDNGIDKATIFEKLKIDRNNDEIQLLSENNKKKRFTDDSAMTKSVALSLINKKEFDDVDMASRFSEEYHQDRFRGYGGAVVSIFSQWKNKDITKENVFLPGKSQFVGSGSYGNGGAMRISPVSLYAKSINECIEVARKTALLTHSNKHGYNGAILQALAVYFALIEDNTIKFDAFGFIEKLKAHMSNLEGDYQKPENYNLERFIESKDFTFTHQLNVISDLLRLNQDKDYMESVQNTIQKLGHGVSAMESVPAALYSFLHNVQYGFEETLYFSISLGGDTDTIASMACAMAGAYHGFQKIPYSWISACESSDEFSQYAEQLIELRKEREEQEKLP